MVQPQPIDGRTQALLHGAAGAAVALTAGALDQLTKWIAASSLHAEQPLTLIPGLLSLRLRANPNGAFGMFAGLPDGVRLPLLLLLSLLAMAAICVLTVRTLGWNRGVALALGLVLGGAAANWLDRLLRGEVVDFIHLHWAERWHWPTFNLADVAITAGSLLLAALVLRFWKRRTTDEAVVETEEERS